MLGLDWLMFLALIELGCDALEWTELGLLVYWIRSRNVVLLRGGQWRFVVMYWIG